MPQNGKEIDKEKVLVKSACDVEEKLLIDFYKYQSDRKNPE